MSRPSERLLNVLDRRAHAYRATRQDRRHVEAEQNLIEIVSVNARLAAKLVGHRPTAWHSLVPPIDVTNSALVANAYLKAALKLCLAVADDLTKRAPSVTLWWRLAAGGEIHIALGDIENEAPAARDHVPASS